MMDEIKLENDLAAKFNVIKTYYGFKSDIELLRFMIKEKYREIFENLVTENDSEAQISNPKLLAIQNLSEEQKVVILNILHRFINVDYFDQV